MADLATDLKAWLAATGRKGSDRVFRRAVGTGQDHEA